MIRIKVRPGHEAARALADIKMTIASHPGQHDVVIEAGKRKLELGEYWRVKNTDRALAELSRYGVVTVE